MIITAWNNGAHARNGSGYGFKVSIADRDAYFQPDWNTILVELEGETEPVEMKINKDTFWSETCREVISPELGRWLRKQGLSPWPQGNPPRLNLEPISDNRFRILKVPKQSGGLRR